MNNLFSGQENRKILEMGQEGSYINKFILQVYGWMTLGIFITAIVSLGVLILSSYSKSFGALVEMSFPFVLILELIVVIALSFFAKKLNGLVALGLFIFYAVLNGIFFGALMQIYTLESITIAFGATFLTFGVMSLYGYFTKADLTKFRSLALMGLFGLIIASIINVIILLINPGLGNGLFWILTYVGLGIFVVLVATDTQKLKNIASSTENSSGSILNYSIQGALMLYLDFINIFIRILFITGKRK